MLSLSVLGLMVNAYCIRTTRWLPNRSHLAVYAADVAAQLLFAYGFARMTEAHTGALRGWLRRKLGRTVPTRALSTE